MQAKDQFKSQNFLIIGGAGYVGSHVTKLLNHRGFKTVVLDDFSTGHKKFIIGKHYEGRAGDKSLIRKILREEKITGVMHFAAKALVGESMENPLLYFQNNVVETIQLLETMLEEKVVKFVFSSTCSTFGEPKTVPISENIPQNPVNPYGLSKLMVENILRELARAQGLKAVALRYFNAAGADPDGDLGEEHDPETHLIPRATKAGLGILPPLTIFGNDYATKDGSCIRDYVHVNDLAAAHIAAMEWLEKQKTPVFEHFNLGSESGFSVFEVIQSIEKYLGKKIPQNIGQRRPGDPPVLIADSKKANTVLNWKTTYSLDDIIKTAVNYHKNATK